MQVIAIVHCKKGTSLRDAIVAQLMRSAMSNLEVSEVQRNTRNPGWTKVHSTGEMGGDVKRGAINIRWVAASSTLECRVVTRGTRKASPILGDFITYLFNHHRTRIKALTVTSP